MHSSLAFSTADMTRWLTSTAGDEAQGSARYPMQLVRVSVPATRPEELDAFVATARLDLDVKGGAQRNCGYRAVEVPGRAAKESEIPNFKGSYLGHFSLVLANSWTSDHLSERSRSVDAFSGTRARETLTLKRR